MTSKRLPLVMMLTVALIGIGSGLAALALAGDPPAGAPGSLTVTVVDVKDQPAVGVIFGLYAAVDPSKVHSGGGGGTPHPLPNAVIGVEDPIELQKGIGKAIFSGKTDEKGMVEAKSVPAGKYQYRCGNGVKGIKSGAIEIEAGKAQSLQLKLEPPKKPA